MKADHLGLGNTCKHQVEPLKVAVLHCKSTVRDAKGLDYIFYITYTYKYINTSLYIYIVIYIYINL